MIWFNFNFNSSQWSKCCPLVIIDLAKSSWTLPSRPLPLNSLVVSMRRVVGDNIATGRVAIPRSEHLVWVLLIRSCGSCPPCRLRACNIVLPDSKKYLPGGFVAHGLLLLAFLEITACELLLFHNFSLFFLCSPLVVDVANFLTNCLL